MLAKTADRSANGLAAQSRKLERKPCAYCGSAQTADNAFQLEP